MSNTYFSQIVSSSTIRITTVSIVSERVLTDCFILESNYLHFFTDRELKVKNSNKISSVLDATKL